MVGQQRPLLVQRIAQILLWYLRYLLRRKLNKKNFLSSLPGGAAAHNVLEHPSLIFIGKKYSKCAFTCMRVCICVHMRVHECVCARVRKRGDPKFHNPNLETVFVFKKKLHIPYSQASDSQMMKIR